SMQNTHIPPTF
nr:immunoglobulin light chain junction region [Macaca mulatta]MOX51572.1 immunoglobulin light chain junction region [Macaca mulatta]MOX51640.1 immunoglobulin light chain junction region [Macaca mulatta]MOX52072.1 immunoglobulin light chain junction region [Macaca mulatta]MOX52303.1 immunoglobulin light chain junction region [Macaca mulatta]